MAEDADRICAVQKEVYAVIAEDRCCTWRGVESNVRRAMEQAWKHNHSYMETLAGHPLDSCPTAAEFVYLCARRVAWRCAEENSMT